MKNWPGVYSASVHNTADPQGRNRVQLKIPQVLGNSISAWAVPFALVDPSPVPAVGAAVHAMFQGGDPAHPVYSPQVQTPTLFASFDANVTEDNPGAWWRMDDATGSTSVLDDTGNGHNGTPSNVTFQQAQAVDSVPSARFNGTSSRIVTTYTTPAFTAFTAEIWVNLNGVTPSGTTDQILGGGNTGKSGAADINDSFSIVMTDSTRAPSVNIGTGSAFRSFSLGAVLPTTGWTHLAVTWDGTNVVCYQNGATASTTPFAGPVAAGVNPVAIGASLGSSPANWYSGLLSEAVIYPAALTSGRVLAHFKARSGAITSANIATGSITSDQIAAGTIIAGSVNGTTITGATIIADGTTGGFFGYSAAPALGNILSAVVGKQMTDSKGNSIPAGITSWVYTPGSDTYYMTLNDQAIPGLFGVGSALSFNDLTNPMNQPGYIGFTGQGTGGLVPGGEISIYTGQGDSSDSPAQIQLVSQERALGVGQPYIASSMTLALVSGAREIWHSLGTLAGATVNSAQYRMMPDGTVLMEIDITFSGSPAVTTITFANTLPAAYQPRSAGPDIRCAMAQTSASGSLSRIFVGAAGGANAGLVQLGGFSSGTYNGTYSAQIRYSVF